MWEIIRTSWNPGGPERFGRFVRFGRVGRFGGVGKFGKFGTLRKIIIRGKN